MAATIESLNKSIMSTTSYDSALCVIPPQDQCSDIDKLRSLYDKGYTKWPPHINLIYPFVAPDSLSGAKAQIESLLNSDLDGPATVTLDHSGHFKHRNNSTIFLREGADHTETALERLRALALRALGQTPSPCNFHLTVGQSEDETESTRNFLLDKASRIPKLTFEVGSLAVLVRERDAGEAGRMRLWGTIELPGSQPSSGILIPEFWLREEGPNTLLSDSDDETKTQISLSALSRKVQPGTTHQFDAESESWCPAPYSVQDMSSPTSLGVSSYNMLIDSEYPPARDRDPLLVDTILSDAALADVLVMQEVSDDFLSFLLAHDEVRRQYPYTSHGPPSQPDIGPLPSLRNVVVLSKHHFRWEFVPFHRRHKGAVVATFPSFAEDALPLVVAGVHLTCGLTDGSVAAKKVQLQNLTSHLKQSYVANPWIIAGDFNITTSKHTIDEAVKSKSISQQTAGTLESIETRISEAGLLDAWTLARVEGTDDSEKMDTNDLFEGEEGATFNPRENALAAATSGSSRNRPQRYDRILVRSQEVFSVKSFHQFGLPQTVDCVASVPSDHSGIRATFSIHDGSQHQSAENTEILQRFPVEHRYAPSHLSRVRDLQGALAKRSVFPTAEDHQRRRNALTLVKDVLLGSSNDGDSSASDVPMVIVPVGSYALGVWTAASDIDCLCIGSISSKTFFRLAIQRIHKAQSRGVRLLRKVQANTGTMLELSVLGVNMDLQYCPAAGIVQRWLDFSSLHPSDPVFNLPILSLRKLKPIRDLNYIQRTIPTMASFRLAYHFIKLWAVERGIYSAKFGYFGGIHITLMLSWVCKRLAHDVGTVGASDLVVTFFYHYAHFDWKKNIVFDVFFHKKMPRYQRSLREPMAILGFYAPNSNIAHTATAPGLQVLVNELKRADKRLSAPGMTWNGFFNEHASVDSGANDFLMTHESYVKIDIQYWGRALSKGRGLVGWVESRCINLVVDIHKVVPHLSVRIWPARFANSDANDTDTYYHGCYLIGFSRTEGGDVPATKEDRANAKQMVEKTFERFLEQVRADEKYYDASTCWIDVSLAKPSEVKTLKLDDREWGEDTMEIEPDSDDEDELLDLDDEPTDHQPSRKLPTRRNASPSSSHTQMPVSTSKLRPASDVLNRLRWDPSLDPSDYIVGYEDRFLGAKETSLERWKTEQTDEEFIPQHRILYFKTRGNGGVEGKVVWERATRVDRVFGSGVGAGDRADVKMAGDGGGEAEI
ncbi:hypothetical protein K458DRAFT_492786 [Lentithecium fluviatile CBS 122367]|uniref:polynucleotide adenylyltransferase n=1 Tax=Lentithecium fluviatile CBS 122367 TaxID=1168545 RepID=A0A6G1ICQ8_9PLEO|nr:hypothetical protein K458DRAFT_492786 [Lentithecium fluviatile CBS 122367]